MSLESAKGRLNRQPGESVTGYITSEDIKQAFDDLAEGWQADIAAGGGGGGVSQAELDAATAPKADKTYVDAQDSVDTRTTRGGGGGGDASACGLDQRQASGLVKGDGTTDDTAAIRSGTDCAGVGATIYFPKGI